MDQYRWLVYAIVAAVAAALVGIFGKVGMKDIDSNLATTIRSIVMTLFLLGIAWYGQFWSKASSLHHKAMLMIVLSGVAGATSWLFGFKAIQLSKVSKVAPIDKMSVPLAAVLAVAFLGERPSLWNWCGIGLIAVGAYLAAL